MIIRLVISLLLLLLPEIAGAACSWSGDSQATAASASYADVSDCLDDANWGAGDTLIIPAGTETWDDPVTISWNSISIQGVGNTSTILKTNTEASVAADGIFIVGAATSGVTIKNIGFEPTTKVDTNAYNAPIWLNGVTDVVIYNCKFDGFKWAIFSWTTQKVVIAGNTFIDGGIQTYGSAIADWGTALGLGDENWMFIEGNSFSTGISQIVHIVLGYAGAKYVFRYNTITSTDASYYVGDAVDAHGYGYGLGATSARSTRGWDVYNNYFYKKGSESRALFLRGGTGTAHHNIFDEITGGAYAYSEIRLQDERLRVPDALADPETTGAARGCAYGVSNAGGCAANEGEPCCDQVGRGANQASEPAYFWGNYKCTSSPCLSNLVAISPTVEAAAATYIEENEDFYNSEKVGYTTYQCPHPATGLAGSCSGYGADGYGVASHSVSAGQGTTISVGTGSTVTWGN